MSNSCYSNTVAPPVPCLYILYIVDVPAARTSRWWEWLRSFHLSFNTPPPLSFFDQAEVNNPGGGRSLRRTSHSAAHWQLQHRKKVENWNRKSGKKEREGPLAGSAYGTVLHVAVGAPLHAVGTHICAYMHAPIKFLQAIRQLPISAISFFNSIISFLIEFTAATIKLPTTAYVHPRTYD
jgi:hypothetical protein